jgi:hypothetical protein
MAQLNPATTLPASSQDALEIFDERYLAASQALLAQPQTWVGELGEDFPTRPRCRRTTRCRSSR